MMKKGVLKLVSKLPKGMLSKLVLKGILGKSVDISDEFYQKDFKNFTLKVNWDICGVKGYQIFEQTAYTKKYGEFLEDADVTLTINNIEHVKLMITDKNLHIEMSRDVDDNFQLCIQDPLIISRFKKQGTNPLILGHLPLFSDMRKKMVYGKSLFNKPDDEVVEKEEIVSLLKKMLENTNIKSDERYQENFKDRVYKVNWDINGIQAYQIFEETRYSYKYGELLEDPDVTLTPTSMLYAKLLLRGDPIDITYAKDADNNFQLCAKIPMLTTRFKDPTVSPLVLSKLPFTSSFTNVEGSVGGIEEYGSYIPVNVSMGEYKNEVVPLKVFEHFISRASNIVVVHCPCRRNYKCTDHSIIHGCMYMGDDTKNMVLNPEEQRNISKEEAVQYVKEAIEDGLIPLIGRSVGESEGQTVRDTGHFLSSCFCCTCCCINGKMFSNASEATVSSTMLEKIKGLEVKIDPAKCVGCGTCLEVCVYKGRELIEGKATIMEHCLGCGRCVEVCPNGAISIEIEDSSYIDEMISRIEAIVDVEPQKTKTTT
jgi:ferredoxin